MNKSVLRGLLLCVCVGLAAPAASAQDGIKVQILSATVKDQTISGAEVLLQQNGQASIQGKSDASGAFESRALGGLKDDTSALIIIKKPGYSTLVAKCPCDGMTYAISPIMTQLDGMRVVLNWGRSPMDLDSHLVFPGNHVYFSNKDGTDTQLDVDDTDSYGPETITIRNKHAGQRYVYAVHNYSARSDSGDDTLGRSQARVRVYIGQTLVRSYTVQPGKVGNLWVVFAVNAAGEFEDINRYEGADNETAFVDELRGMSTSTVSLSSARNVSAADKAEAQRLNREGETACHRPDYETAIRMFQQAIDLDPDYAQAYSNLGLTFQKAGNEAEAIWANRKGIALASGPNANRVRASSYYNIARIYEAKQQWRQAMETFQSAESEKHHESYVKGIARMKAKLGE